jgi:transcriptional regulator with GAF, ATPase, and Fis domain
MEQIAIDVRVISATDRDLDKQVAENLFREDLCYRLSVIPIYIPPLRQRQEDIP